MTKLVRHRLLAVLAADAAGYSRLMAQDDVGTLQALESARESFRCHVEAEDGRIVDTSGDSVLAVFDTSAGAVQAAIRIQSELVDQAEQLPHDRRLLFRIGIHLGDIVEKPDGTVYGDGVNIASRLQALSKPGGVLVSHSVEETAANRTHAEFEDLGEHAVKNIAKPIRAFRVLVRELGQPASPAAKPRGVTTSAALASGVARPELERAPRDAPFHARWRLSLVGSAFFVAALVAGAVALWRHPDVPTVNIDEEVVARRAVAVLAFGDKRVNGNVASLGDDLADAIGSQLQRNGMRVIHRSAAGQQNPAAPEFERIGAEQRVKFVLNGRITQVGDSARVATNLTEIATGAVYRLFQADLKAEDESARGRYAQQVTSSLRARYVEIETTRARLPGREKDPVDAIVLAWRDVDRGGADDLRSALNRFEFAARSDPNSLDALSGLGATHLMEFYYFYSAAPLEKLDMAEQVLKRGLDLGRDHPQILAAWAEMLMLRQKPEESLWMWKRAIEANPDDQTAHSRFASALIRQGRYVEAGQHIEQVFELRPVVARQHQWLHQTRADLAFAQQRDAEAYDILRNWTAESPNNGRPYLMLAAIDALHGRAASAKANMARHRQMLPHSNMAYVELNYPSSDPGFLAQRARLIEGLRKAGLPEGSR
jgi:class 3 adenylate cyclase/TolB-like protein